MLSSMDTYMLLTKWDVSTGKIAPYAVGKLRRAYCDITGCFVLGYEVFAAIEIFE